jgi:hypothetical protein
MPRPIHFVGLMVDGLPSWPSIEEDRTLSHS